MRLIDADALKCAIEKRMDDIVCEEFAEGMSEALLEIDYQPTIEERKTGRWIKISPAGIYECSECGKNVMTSDIDAYEFCHGCGAKMDKEDGYA